MGAEGIWEGTVSWMLLRLRVAQGPLAAVQSQTEEGHTAPLGPGPAWLAADQRAKAVVLRVQILSAPAQRGASAPHLRAGVPSFPPFRELRGVVSTNAQYGNGDVGKTLPVRSPLLSFPGVSLLLSLTSALGEGGGLLLDLAESGGKRVQEEGPTTFPHLNP